MKHLITLACLTLLNGVAHAFYVETRSTDEGGEAVPIRYAPDEETGAIRVTYRFNPASFPDAEGIEDALHASFDAWTNVECSTLEYLPGDASDSMENSHWRYDEGEIYVLVFFSDDPSEWTAGPSVGHFFWAHDGTGKLVGGTVVLNSKDHDWATDGSDDAMDVQAIATALIGRAMGITSNIEGNATFGRYRTGDVERRALGSDDIEALTYLYLAEGCDASEPPVEMCDGSRRVGDDSCPPRPTTSPPPPRSDAGTPPPRSDAGGDVDAGRPTDDAGLSMPPDRDVPGSGGGCSAANGSGTTACWMLLALGLRRRRSKR